MKKLVFQLALGLLSILTLPLNAQKYDPGSGNTVLLIGQTFQQEYINYVNGVGFAPSGSSHYGSIYLGTIEQGDDNPNAKFLDYVRSVQDDNYALVAISIKDNTAAGGYGQMINPAWGQFNSNAVWEACDDIRNGKWDSEIDQMAQTFADRPDVKFYVRVGYEVSLFMFGYKGEQNANTWLEEQANAGVNVFEDPDKVDQMDRHAYIEAYNHIASRIKRKASNVSFVYHPVRGFNDTKWLYPGDENVDFVAFSIFNNDVCIECNGTFNCEGEDVDPNLQQSMDFAKEHGKPLMIAESACQAPATGSPSAFNDYLNRLDKVVKNNDVRVLAYINSDWPAHDWDANWGDSRVEVNSTVLNYWKSTFGQGTRYLHSGGSVPTPTCNDGIQNGNETGVDCGGSCPACNGTTPTCNDGIQNGNETGVDCGGSCPACQTTNNCPASHPYECGGSCYEDAAQAASSGCARVDRDGNCPASHPYECDGACYTNEAQAQASGCTGGGGNGGGGNSGNCPASHPYECDGKCYEDAAQAQASGCTGGGGNEPTCNDGIQNGNETGVDCGGSCPACSTEPTCNDGIQNGNETGVDCGGSCPACSNEPSCYDGIQNGDETGVDCGGSCAPCGTSGDYTTGKFSPKEKKALLIIGQDMGSVNGYKNSGQFPELGGVTQYTDMFTLAGLKTTTNYGAGDMCLQCAMDENPNSTLSIGLWMVEDNDGVGQDHPTGLSDIVNGRHDQQITELGQFAIDNAPTPIFLRIGYEFDGEWNHYDANRYKAAYRYMVDKWRAMGVTNMAYVWQSATWGADDPNLMPNWYPGDNYVDYVGVSFFFYDEGFNGDNLKYALDYARGKNKPVMMAEVSAQYYEFDQNTYHWVGDGASLQGVHMSSEDMWNQFFADQLLPFVYQNDDVIRVVAYINCDWQSQPQWKFPDANNGFWGDTRIEANNYITSQWKKEIAKPFWLHGGPNLLSQLVGTKSAHALSASNVVKETTELEVYPNPTTGEITISGLDVNGSYTIYNFAGNAIVKDNKTQIDVSSLPAGMYFIKSNTNKTISFVKK